MGRAGTRLVWQTLVPQDHGVSTVNQIRTWLELLILWFFLLLFSKLSCNAVVDAEICPGRGDHSQNLRPRASAIFFD